MPDTSPSMDMGPQPLDALMDELNVNNHALVDASTEQITHKMVTKGRRGRRLTANIQGKLLRALNNLGLREEPFVMEELFNYEGK